MPAKDKICFVSGEYFVITFDVYLVHFCMTDSLRDSFDSKLHLLQPDRLSLSRGVIDDQPGGEICKGLQMSENQQLFSWGVWYPDPFKSTNPKRVEYRCVLLNSKVIRSENPMKRVNFKLSLQKAFALPLLKFVRTFQVNQLCYLGEYAVVVWSKGIFLQSVTRLMCGPGCFLVAPCC